MKGLTGVIAVLSLAFIAVEVFAVEPKAVQKNPLEKQGSVMPKPVKETIIDGFEANDWLPSNAEGTTIKTSLSFGVGKVGKALQVDYDLKNTGQWVSIMKDVSFSDYEGKAMRFYLKSIGQKMNNLEIKLIDEDGSTFGYKIPLKSSDTWELVSIDMSDFTYWWGGNKALNTVAQVGFAVSAGNGDSGMIILDDLRLVPSAKKLDKVQAGVLDPCDTTSGWKIEGDGGVTFKLLSIPGKDKQAVSMDYQFGSGKWVQIVKNFSMELTEKSVFSFWFKWNGEVNNLEFKLMDKDNTVFGKKTEFVGGQGEWQEIKIPMSELTYWWGGDDKELDLKSVRSVWFAVSIPKGGDGSVAIDQLNLENLP